MRTLLRSLTFALILVLLIGVGVFGYATATTDVTRTVWVLAVGYIVVTLAGLWLIGKAYMKHGFVCRFV